MVSVQTMKIPITQGHIDRESNIVLNLNAEANEIVRVVAHTFHIQPVRLYERTMSWQVSHPRMLAMFMIREKLGWTHKQIGNYFGGMNKDTIRHGCRQVENWSGWDGVFQAKRQAVERAL